MAPRCSLDVSGELNVHGEICFSLSNGILDAEESLRRKLGWKFKILLGLPSRSTGCVYANFGLTVVIYFGPSFWISFGCRGNNLEFFLFYFIFNRIFKKGVGLLHKQFRKVEVEVERMKSTQSKGTVIINKFFPS